MGSACDEKLGLTSQIAILNETGMRSQTVTASGRDAMSNGMLAHVDQIGSMIRTIRGQKVILDADLARIYGVPTKILNKAVRRNLERFPDDFIFQLSWEELENLKFQFGTSSLHGGRRKLPYAFTENGAIMVECSL
jgi:hypothetical protein